MSAEAAAVPDIPVPPPVAPEAKAEPHPTTTLPVGTAFEEGAEEEEPEDEEDADESGSEYVASDDDGPGLAALVQEEDLPEDDQDADFAAVPVAEEADPDLPEDEEEDEETRGPVEDLGPRKRQKV